MEENTFTIFVEEAEFAALDSEKQRKCCFYNVNSAIVFIQYTVY